MPAPARYLAAAALALSVMAIARGAGTAAGQAALVEPASFHHLHLVSGGPAWLASYYASLFVPASVTRGVFWSLEGVRGADAYLLVSRLEGGRDGEANTRDLALRLGPRVTRRDVSRHYVKEVNWRPPYAALEADFHVHLRSRDPLRAGRWYRDVLGGTLEESPPLERGITEDERVDALVRFRSVLLALHRWSGPLVSTSEAGTVDHLGVSRARSRHACSKPARPERGTETGRISAAVESNVDRGRPRPRS